MHVLVGVNIEHLIVRRQRIVEINLDVLISGECSILARGVAQGHTEIVDALKRSADGLPAGRRHRNLDRLAAPRKQKSLLQIERVVLAPDTCEVARG